MIKKYKHRRGCVMCNCIILFILYGDYVQFFACHIFVEKNHTRGFIYLLRRGDGVKVRGVAYILVFDLLDPSSYCIVYIKTPPGDPGPSSLVRIMSTLLMDNSSSYNEKNDNNEEKHGRAYYN